MARSRRRQKKNRPKVRVGLPKRKPNRFKPAFTVPDALTGPGQTAVWDDDGTVLRNYKAFGVVSNPNLLGVRARTPHIVQCSTLQVLVRERQSVSEFDPIDGGSDLESDDLKSALGKRRRDGKVATPQPLTRIQRVHVGRLVEKHGDDYEAMFKDTKLNTMQHPVAVLRKLCQRYHLIPPLTSRFKLRKMGMVAANPDKSSITLSEEEGEELT